MSTHCKGLIGRIFGHKFTARNSVDRIQQAPPPELVKIALEGLGSPEEVEGLVNAVASAYCTTNTIYECDMCVRCGEMVEPVGIDADAYNKAVEEHNRSVNGYNKSVDDMDAEELIDGIKDEVDKGSGGKSI